MPALFDRIASHKARFIPDFGPPTSATTPLQPPAIDEIRRWISSSCGRRKYAVNSVWVVEFARPMPMTERISS